MLVDIKSHSYVTKYSVFSRNKNSEAYCSCKPDSLFDPKLVWVLDLLIPRSSILSVLEESYKLCDRRHEKNTSVFIYSLSDFE